MPPQPGILSLLLICLVSLLNVAYAAPAAAFIARNITIDNVSNLLQYSPPVCKTQFPVVDPLALDPDPCNGTWITVLNPNYFEMSTSAATGISQHFGNESPSVSFRFAGTAVYWYTTSYPFQRGGLAAVKLDDALPVLVNTSSLLPGDLIVYNVVGFAVRGLDPNVVHTISVTLIPQPVTLPGNPVILLDVDAFVYTEVPDLPSSTFTNDPTSTSPTPLSTSLATSTVTNGKPAQFTGALIALSVGGSLLVATVVACAVVFFYRRKRRRKQPPAMITVDRTPTVIHGRGPSLVGPIMTERERDLAPPSGRYVYG